jgi:hypothetical protein
MRRLFLLVAVITMVGFVADFVNAGREDGQRGNSDVIQLNLTLFDDGDDPLYADAWGLVTVKVNDDGDPETEDTVDIIVNAKNLIPGASYEVRSGGDVVGGGTANKGGNLHVQARDIATGARINVWEAERNLRVLRTEAEL